MARRASLLISAGFWLLLLVVVDSIVSWGHGDIQSMVLHRWTGSLLRMPGHGGGGSNGGAAGSVASSMQHTATTPATRPTATTFRGLPWCTAAAADAAAPSFAVLISGQLQRFSWRDQSEPLISFPHWRNRSCAPIVDVFIAIHNGTTSTPFVGTVNDPPYRNLTTTAAVTEWYAARGARQVHVRWFTDSDMDRMQADVDTKVVAGNATTLASIRGFGRPRYVANLRMFYLRHEAYAMAMAGGGRAYWAFTFWREDNFWFKPLRESDFLVVRPPGDGGEDALSSSPGGVVGVDKHCGWGFYSDKVYVASPGGADRLFFGQSQDTFYRVLARWCAWANWRGRDGGDVKDSKTGGWFQTEAFLATQVLRGSEVHEIDLHRADVRYNGGRLCSPRVYWDFGCASPMIQTQDVIGRC